VAAVSSWREHPHPEGNQVGPRRKAIPRKNRYLRRAAPDRPSLSRRRLLRLVLGVAFAFFAVQFVAGDRGLVRRWGLEQDLQALEAANAALTAEKAALIRDLDFRENDPFALEKLAREKYWLVRENELIFRFEDDEVVPELEGVGAPAAAESGEPDQEP
jgi:cell division protein FtsB